MVPDGKHTDSSGSRWKIEPGRHVEVHTSRGGTRRGVIEVIMKDKSGFWLAADGVEPRVFVPLGDKEHSIRPAPAPGKVLSE